MIKKVLIVEDVVENRYLLNYLLRANGWEVAEAIDGVSALKLAPHLLPSLILMDVGLPGGLDGYSLVGLLRAIPELSGTYIVAVTSYAMGGDRESALAAGCNGYIEKPIDPDRFLTQISEIMSHP